MVVVPDEVCPFSQILSILLVSSYALIVLNASQLGSGEFVCRSAVVDIIKRLETTLDVPAYLP